MMRNGSEERQVPQSLQYEGWKFDASDFLKDRLGPDRQMWINHTIHSIPWVLMQELSSNDFQAVLLHLYNNHPCRGGKL